MTRVEFELLAPLNLLFQENSVTAAPLAGERQLLERLENRAGELETAPRDAAHAADVSVQRRFLLLDLEGAGLFDASNGLRKDQWLRQWGFGQLEGYRAAAMQMRRYFHSAEREQRLPSIEFQRVVGAPVSVDWFRRGAAGFQGLTPFEWLACCEEAARLDEIVDGGEGDILARLHRRWYRIYWRRDDAIHPSLVSSEPCA